jgi:hypothetical protein
MAKESEITKSITRTLKAGDKLVQDVQRDIGQLLAAADAFKQLIDQAKERFKGPDDKEV